MIYLKSNPEKEAKRLVKMFKDIVCIDYRYDEQPIFELQQVAARKVCDELIKQCKAFELNEQKIFLLEVKREILKLKE